MNRYLLFCIIAIALGVGTLATLGYGYADTPAISEVADTATADVATGDIAGPTPEWLDKDPAEPGSNADIVTRLDEAKKALERYRSAESGKTVLLFLLLAAVCNLLLSGLKRWRQLSDRGKKFLPWIALGLGVAVGFLSYAGTGAGMLESLLYGAGPPFAVLIQELVGPIKSKPAEQ